ncbi:RNA polymerase subunit sigma [Nonomuraea sp. WAC 01424]|uniref:sigma-70 family RNA polymerase sigma factor n=1 Tax=Nonomuraea sp. WAC 01424 TaxID=2203200 RepID=UPI000F79C8CD|nr:sigma-70 family RNA polymerase sigma factor [Nonomuraea sp. WAC 01424]RSN03129.1 RNA polymerase subunit sigma [Nonomuraea sp. WAC 01424]
MEKVGSFARCLEVLIEDSERMGRISRSHAVSVAGRRGLSPEDTARLIDALAKQDVLEGGEGAPRFSTLVGTKSSAYGPRRRSLQLNSEIPARMGAHRILNAEDEVELARCIQMGMRAREAREVGESTDRLEELIADGDRARQYLIASNVRLAISIARSFLPSAGDLELDDLIQEGIFGLDRAAEKFDPQLGYKFSTYATWWVKQTISRAICNQSTAIRLPVHVWEQVNEIRRYVRGFEVRNGTAPTVLEIAGALGKSAGTIKAIMDYAAPVVHLDAPLSTEGGELTSLGELVLHSLTDSVEDKVMEIEMRNAIHERIEFIASGYDRRFLRILEGRCGFNGHEEMTLEQLGQEFGISRERVRQLEKKVKERIRSDAILVQLARDFKEGLHGAA